MITNQTDLSQENNVHDSGSTKIALERIHAQRIIKKKYEKALMNRLEHEGNVNRTIKPSLNATTTIDASRTNELNPNDLCMKLKSLLDATFRNKDKTIHIAEMNSIIAKLHDLHILI